MLFLFLILSWFGGSRFGGQPGLSASHVGEYVGFYTKQDIHLEVFILPVDSDREQLDPITTFLAHRCGALLHGILLKAIKSEKYW